LRTLRFSSYRFLGLTEVPGRRDDAMSEFGWVTDVLSYSSLNRIVKDVKKETS